MLNAMQTQKLMDAIAKYDFPVSVADFHDSSHAGDWTPLDMVTIKMLEGYFAKALRSGNQAEVKDGLSNVIYWGYNRIGYRDTRVTIFRSGGTRQGRWIGPVTEEQIKDFMKSVSGGKLPDLWTIMKIGMPEFSRISFISKIVAFLDPVSHCVLDRKIAGLREAGVGALADLVGQTSSIVIDDHNAAVYEAWCRECCQIANELNKLGDGIRAVDVERGFFKMISDKQLEWAKEIYRAAVS